MRRRRRISSRLPSAATKERIRVCPSIVTVVSIGFGTLFSVALFFTYYHQSEETSKRLVRIGSLPMSSQQQTPSVVGPCAINLYGLPRRFKDLVLTGLMENVIHENARYQCDYYVHYYDRREESDYRGADRGRGGTIDPEEVKLLTAEVEKAHDLFVRSHPRQDDERIPNVEFIKDTEDDFFELYTPLLKQIYSKRGGPLGNLIYIPLSEKEPFPNATIVNIIKMWHSQESVWRLMEPLQSSPPRRNQRHYSRVAMLRNDVLYVQPIDIYQLPDGSIDFQNECAVIPNFGNFPVNDRMIYGPADAVRIWAAGRFRRIQEHVDRVAVTGDGIHPERFLFHTIFPAIRDAGIPILPFSRNLCFLRVRSDMSIRIGDCGRDCVNDRNQQAIEFILQRPCLLNLSNPDVAFLECKDDVRQQFPTRTTFEKVAWEGCLW